MKITKKALSNNNGSGIITVVITMIIVAALGAALLFISYNGFMIKATERDDKANFYDAAAVMSDIRVGVQEAVTESIAIAYEQTLQEFTSLTDVQVQAKFEEYFVAALFAWETDSDVRLFTPVGVGSTPPGVYNFEALATFLPGSPVYDSSSNKITISNADIKTIITSESNMAVVENTINGEITIDLLGISIAHTNDGFESNIISDISIAMPDFFYSAPDYVNTDLINFSIIAADELKKDGGSGDLKGDVYAGKVNVINGNNLNYLGGLFITADDIDIGVGATFTTNEYTELWAQNLNPAAGNGALSLAGVTHVANDLNIAKNSNVTLAGDYYGFGLGSTADASSAILINGRNASLDMTALNNLFIAGNSFISSGSHLDYTPASVPMGESISIKSNQIAYLVPAEAITYTGLVATTETNPTIVSSSDKGAAGTIKIDISEVLWQDENGGDVTLGDYANGTNPAITIQTPLDTNSSLLYVFINFKDAEKRNQYFKDYFRENKDEMTEYAKLYVGNVVAESEADVFKSITAGHAFYVDAGTIAGKLDDKVTLLNPTATAAGTQLGAYYESLGLSYTNLTKTLSKFTAGTNNPYEHYIDTGAVGALPIGATYFVDSATPAKEVGVIVNGDYIHDSSASTLKVIIATGDVNVNANFKGLIIAGGSVIMGNVTVEPAPTEAKAALSATADASGTLLADGTALHGKPLSDFFQNIDVSTGVTGSVGGVAKNWDLMELVGYKNWKKQ